MQTPNRSLESVGDVPHPQAAHRRVEPWLRGTLTEIDPVRRQVLHALELTGEDADRWCRDLTSAEMHLRPYGLASVAFHLRHIARSLDRLLTYAEGRSLSEQQMSALRSEMAADEPGGRVLEAFHQSLNETAERVKRIALDSFPEPRSVGRAKLPSTVGGLVVHCAEHTQRHAGQMVTTAKLLLAMRKKQPEPEPAG